MNFLAYLADSAFSEWLALSMLGFPTLIALHSVGMAVVVGLSFMIALRLNGFMTGIGRNPISKLLTVAVWGFVLNFLTGLALFITRGPEYITSYMFLTKLLLVIGGAAILFWLKQRLHPESTATGESAADRVTGLMSLVAAATWLGAVISGRLIAYLSDLY